MVEVNVGDWVIWRVDTNCSYSTAHIARAEVVRPKTIKLSRKEGEKSNWYNQVNCEKVIFFHPVEMQARLVFDEILKLCDRNNRLMAGARSHYDDRVNDIIKEISDDQERIAKAYGGGQ